MMPAHLDNWVQTTVPPVPDPDPALFLHGPEPGSGDVNLVWRADLTANLVKEKDTAVDVVALVPPTSMEALPVPVWAVKRWLKDEGRSDLPDLEAPSIRSSTNRRVGASSVCAGMARMTMKRRLSSQMRMRSARGYHCGPFRIWWGRRVRLEAG